MHRLKALLPLLAILLVIGAGPAVAGWEEGIAAFKKGNYSQAATEFEQLVSQRPDWPGGYLMLGQSQLKLGKAHDAVRNLRKAYDLEPNDSNSWLPLAQAYLSAGRADDAAQLLNTVDSSKLPKERQSIFFQLRAAAMQKSGQSDAAAEDLRRAARSNPNDAEAQYRYGAAMLAARDTDAAIAALQASVRLDPNDPDKKRSLAKAFILKGRQSQGNVKMAAYRQAAQTATELTRASSSYDDLMLLGDSRLGAKDYDGAIEAYRRAQAKNAGDWLPLFYIGQAQTAKEQYDSAEQSLKQALGKTASRDDLEHIWGQLGFVYEKQKDYAQAIAYYQKIGDQRSVERVQENQKIAEENKLIEEHNQLVKELEEEKKALEEQMKDLPPD